MNDFFFQIDSQLTFMWVKKKGNRTLQKNLQLVLSSNPVFSSLLQFGDIANFSFDFKDETYKYNLNFCFS